MTYIDLMTSTNTNLRNLDRAARRKLKEFVVFGLDRNTCGQLSTFSKVFANDAFCTTHHKIILAIHCK